MARTADIKVKLADLPDVQRLIANLIAHAERAEAERDAARSVIRRCDGSLTIEGLLFYFGSTLTPAEVAEIHAATRQPQDPE